MYILNIIYIYKIKNITYSIEILYIIYNIY